MWGNAKNSINAVTEHIGRVSECCVGCLAVVAVENFLHFKSNEEEGHGKRNSRKCNKSIKAEWKTFVSPISIPPDIRCSL